MRIPFRLAALTLLIAAVSFSCTKSKKTANRSLLESIEVLRGELALCGAPDFGKVNFGLTCTGEVQKDFNLAIALLHSFEYREAEKAFVRVIDADPQCAIGYWGVAMSNLHELWAPPNAKELEKCSQILAIARSLPTKSAQEADYIDAISIYYSDYDKDGHQVRANRYSDRMKELYLRYPDDKEAAIFYALALNGTADPADKTYAKQREASRILKELFPDQPDHPGIAHYLIHNNDYPELASEALDAARRYASIAPASAHAQHMPSHIFTRLGLWDESISSNIRSADAAVCYAENMEMPGHWNQETHALDYLMYAYLQQADDDKASEVMAYVNDMRPADTDNFADAYAYAAMPARYALERRQWSEASGLQLHPKDFQWDNYPWERGIVYFARSMGNARLGNAEQARAELGQLNAAYDQLVGREDAYKSNQVDIQVKAASAWIALAEGRHKEAVKLLRAAADAEDATEKHPVTPGEVLPAREMLADLLMELGQPEEALENYKASLVRAPNRYNTLLGAWKAAVELGLDDEARRFSDQIDSLTGERPRRQAFAALGS